MLHVMSSGLNVLALAGFVVGLLECIAQSVLAIVIWPSASGVLWWSSICFWYFGDGKASAYLALSAPLLLVALHNLLIMMFIESLQAWIELSHSKDVRSTQHSHVGRALAFTFWIKLQLLWLFSFPVNLDGSDFHVSFLIHRSEVESSLSIGRLWSWLCLNLPAVMVAFIQVVLVALISLIIHLFVKQLKELFLDVEVHQVIFAVG